MTSVHLSLRCGVVCAFRIGYTLSYFIGGYSWYLTMRTSLTLNGHVKLWTRHVSFNQNTCFCSNHSFETDLFNESESVEPFLSVNKSLERC